jgi:acetyltransferase-like isoleucine patch superfamily enzyme
MALAGVFASWAERVRVDASALVEAYVTVDAGIHRVTTVGARSWLMKKVHVGHDALIGADCELAPLVSVGGECEIGDGVKVGQGAVFRPRVTVGANSVIGCGAVVVRDVPAGETWAGNPARRLRGSAASVRLTESEEAGWEQMAAVNERMFDLEREIGRLHAAVAAGQTELVTDAVLTQWQAAGVMYLAAKDLLARVQRLSTHGVAPQDLVQCKLAEDELRAGMAAYEQGFATNGRAA